MMIPTTRKIRKEYYAPRINAMELRKILWARFGRRIFIKKRKSMIDIYVTAPEIMHLVAKIVAPYEDLFDAPDAQKFNLIPMRECKIPPHHAHYQKQANA